MAVVAGFVVLAVVLAIGWWSVQERSVSLDLDDLRESAQAAAADGMDGSGAVGSAQAAGSAGLLAQVQQALADGDRAALDELAAGSPRSLTVLRRWADNVEALGLEDLSLRYVAATVAARDAATAEASDRWDAEVEVSYRDPFAGEGRVRTTAAVSFADIDSGDATQVAVVGAGGAGGRTPLWMSSDLVVETEGRVTARVAAGSSLDVGRVARLGEKAVRQVRRTLPAWDGPLVLEVPSGTDGVAHVLGEPEGAYDAVAAVTTTIDGSGDDASPVHVVVNPVVLGTLGNRGEQVVITHEAVHVATGASTAPELPLWLMEGFADWASLRVADLPDDVAAGALLEQVREDGPPGRLPGVLEFDPGGDQFGISYEAAWLAVRLIAEEYGPRAATAFYRQVDDGAAVEQAFDALGTTEADFTVAWQRYLQRLAGVPEVAGATTS